MHVDPGIMRAMRGSYFIAHQSAALPVTVLFLLGMRQTMGMNIACRKEVKTHFRHAGVEPRRPKK